MNGCLVTTLKASISDSSLVRFGCIRVDVLSDITSDSVFLSGASALEGFVVEGTMPNSFGTGVVSLNGAKAGTKLDVKKENLERIYLSNYGQINLNEIKYALNIDRLDCVAVGDVENVKMLLKIGMLNLRGNSTYGDISNLKSLINATDIRLVDTSITGDVSSLRTLSGLTRLDLMNTSIVGDMSVLSKNLRLVNGGGSDRVVKNVSWKNVRSSDSFIMAIGGRMFNFGDDLDSFLINQSNCTPYSDSSVAYRTIDVLGNRTSTSNAAVESLKSKGYTIVINGVAL